MSRITKLRRVLNCSHLDLDGLGAVLIGRLQTHLKFDTVTTFNYDDVTPELIATFAEYTDIYMTDIAIPYEDMETLLEAGCNVTLIDHHERSYEGDGESKGLKHLKHSNFIYKYSDKSCGTKLFYEFCLERTWIESTSQIETFVTLVDLYDRFQSDDELFPEAENLNRTFWGLVGKNFFRQGMVKYSEFLDDQEKKLRRTDRPFAFNLYEKNLIANIVEREEMLTKQAMNSMKIRFDSRGVKFGVIKIPSKISKVSSNIFKLRPDISYMVAVNTFKDWKISTRSQGFNLLQLEGISGHREAAGSNHEIYTPEFCKKFLKRNISLPYIRESPVKRR